MTPGVYILFKDMEPIYVGESKCCENRLKAHKNKDYDHYVIIPTKKHENWEMYFIMFLNPVLNVRWKTNDPLWGKKEVDKFTSLKNDRRRRFYING